MRRHLITIPNSGSRSIRSGIMGKVHSRPGVVDLHESVDSCLSACVVDVHRDGLPGVKSVLELQVVKGIKSGVVLRGDQQEHAGAKHVGDEVQDHSDIEQEMEGGLPLVDEHPGAENGGREAEERKNVDDEAEFFVRQEAVESDEHDTGNEDVKDTTVEGSERNQNKSCE